VTAIAPERQEAVRRGGHGGQASRRPPAHEERHRPRGGRAACAEPSPEEEERKPLLRDVLMSPLHLFSLLFKQFAVWGVNSE